MGVRTQMSYLKIGNLPLILTPGELFPELAQGFDRPFIGDNPDGENPRPFAEILGTDRFLVIGLADDEIGYIVPEEDFHVHPEFPYLQRGYKGARRHYEETNSLGPKTAMMLAETLEKLVEKANSAN